MSKKITLTSLFAFGVFGMVLPSMADDFPTSTGLMQANKTYTGAAISTNMAGVTSGSVNAKPWYELLAGYYLYATTDTTGTVCPAGKYCPGGSSFQLGNGTAGLGNSGNINQGYYSSGGAKTATPTSSSDCVGSNTCGKCITGYNTEGRGSTDVRQCYAYNSSGSCSTFFPSTSDSVNHYTGVVYTTNLAPWLPTPNVSNQTTGTIATASSLINATTAGPYVPIEPGKCVIRGVTCQTNYELSNTAVSVGSDLISFVGSSVSSYFVSSDSVYGTLYRSSTYPDAIGTFDIALTGGYQNQGVGVRGIWVRGSMNSGSITPSSSGTDCGCRVQSVKWGGGWSTYVSDWQPIQNPDLGHQSCGDVCKDYMVDKFTSQTKLNAMGLYEYKCVLGSGIARYTINGGTGKIQNKTPNSNGIVFADCLNTQYLGGRGNGTAGYMGSEYNAVPISQGPTKSGVVLVGWAKEVCDANGNCTRSCDNAECVDTSTKCAANQEEDALFYAVWQDPSCTAGEGVQTATFNSVSDNRVACNTSNKAGYYIGSVSYGAVGTAAVTIDAGKCPTYWNSTAGSATKIQDCTRTIPLSTNGADSGTLSANSVTCNYNTDCTLPSTAGLVKAGYTYTGTWGSDPDCINPANALGAEENLTFYACRTVNKITINWTGVASIPSNSGYGTLSNGAVASEVDYGGNIVTPTSGVAKSGMSFLGWKFTTAN